MLGNRRESYESDLKFVFRERVIFKFDMFCFKEGVGFGREGKEENGLD